ncbi:hypothetical protein LMG28688_01593 [Paraburkholderia caffeinitolerans]|uniref:Nicotinamide riboside transporter PnuC n=1 Tax=Paraburkholderia caffeinitolerans TaxID=1723730 RepID=A0A6J5FQ92_9BURK|nr:hypothetical protein [Paraburkholderia caffeinitolerans]CAB3783170.1 hypothetical protein LMG28688_01593 [Paraburkholderia caffeinitolerans]
MIDQIVIGALGAAAAYLSQDRLDGRRRYACLCGLAAQPFWFYASWTAGQWGIFALSIVYTLAWARGLVTHWLWRRS